MREYKVNITETVMRHVWVTAEDPAEAIEIAEQNYAEEEIIEVTFDVDPTVWRSRDESNWEDDAQ